MKRLFTPQSVGISLFTVREERNHHQGGRKAHVNVKVTCRDSGQHPALQAQAQSWVTRMGLVQSSVLPDLARSDWAVLTAALPFPKLWDLYCLQSPMLLILKSLESLRDV